MSFHSFDAVLWKRFAPGWEVWFDQKAGRWFARQPKLVVRVDAADSFKLVRLIRWCEEYYGRPE